VISSNTASSSSYGIYVDAGARVVNNVAYGNDIGIFAFNGNIIDNRTYDNGTVGIDVDSGMVQGNVSYSNPIGISANYGTVTNNLVYANAEAGISVGNETQLTNNTVYQQVGDAIRIEPGARFVSLRNNILCVDGGYGFAINVPSDSQIGFQSDYNLFSVTGPDAYLGLWQDVAFTDLADWFYELGFDQHSMIGDPQFVDPAGPDGIMGFSELTQIIDNSNVGAGFSDSGEWNYGYDGVNYSNVWSYEGSGDDVATWTFSGLTPGKTYQVAAAWVPMYEWYWNGWRYYRYPVSATNAQYTIFDGTDQVAAQTINQQLYPSDFTDGYTTWESLATITVTGDTLVVQLNDLANGRVVADAMRIQQIGEDHGSDDNFHVALTSPTIDAGDPLSYYLAELGTNGGRINLGSDGNTAEAAPSAEQAIQVLAPNGLEKIEAGSTVNIQWNSSGLAALNTVALINAGGDTVQGGAQGNWLTDAYRVAGSVDSFDWYDSVDTPVDLSGVSDPAPEAVYRSLISAEYGVGGRLAYELPVADGEYTIRLHFAEPDTTFVAGDRVFDINLQGAAVLADYDIVADAGTSARAATRSFTVTAQDRKGISIELVNKTDNGALLSAIELTQANASGVTAPTATIELSTDEGVTWTTIATGVAMDRFGQGSYAWTAGPETVGNSALIRVTADDGSRPSDISDRTFLIANGGASYYVNDDSLEGDEYATAAGDNANSGKSPDAPMASLAALLRAYDLDAGDTIYVDTGVYYPLTNIVLDEQDSGVAIQGPVFAGHDAVLDRGNIEDSSYVIEFWHADDVTIDHLNLTGGTYGIFVNDYSYSERLRISNNAVYGYADGGIYLGLWNDNCDISDNQIYNYGPGNDGGEGGGGEVFGVGIEIYEGYGSLVRGNEVYSNKVGIQVADAAIEVRDNIIHNNSDYGIYGSGYGVVITGNVSYDNGIAVNGDGGEGASYSTPGYGIYVDYEAQAIANVAYGNFWGVFGEESAAVIDNRTYANSIGGIAVDGYSTAQGNVSYSNPVGIQAGYGAGVSNNLVYANTNTGIDVIDSEVRLANNTVYQQAGDAVLIEPGVYDISIENNILWVDAGYGINAFSSSQQDFMSDYNLFYSGSDAARIGAWNSGEALTVAGWQTATGQDSHSLAGTDPLNDFTDIDGVDNVLGARGVTEGNGSDDNFDLRAGSLAIDAANAYAALPYDILHRQRIDDPATPDIGVNLDLFVEQDTTTNQFAEVGVAQNWQGENASWTYDLPFTFSFYGKDYTSVDVSANGVLQFGGPDIFASDGNSLEEFRRNMCIAPLWDNIRTDSPGGDIFIDASVADQVTIRWKGVSNESGSEVNFSVTLFSSGTFRFDYGSGNNGLTPTVGVSAGNDFTFVVSRYNGRWNLASANSPEWQAAPNGISFDIGAFEFQKDFSDVTPPAVTNVFDLPSNGSTTDGVFSSIQISFSEPLDYISANDAANYQLLGAGLDGVFDTADDEMIALQPAYSFPETDLVLELLDGVLADGKYRMTLSGTNAIVDKAGNPLDGNADGIGGDDYVHYFTIVHLANTTPVAGNDAYVILEDTPLVMAALDGVLANDSDVDGDALSAVLVSGPAYGSLSLNADGSFTYTPVANFNGSDGFTYKANDGLVDSTVAMVALTITPMNDEPVAGNDTYTTAEDTPLVITALNGVLANDSDVDGDALSAVLVSGPTNGRLTLNSDGSFTYTPGADFNGTDSFTYRANDGLADSAEAMVALSITPVNDAPVAGNDTYTTAEDSPLVVAALNGVLANDSDVDGDALSSVLVSGPAHGSVALNVDGSFTYTPAADFNGTDSFTYKANDGLADSAEATVAFTITPVNDAPVAGNDAYATAEDTQLVINAAAGVLANDTDVEGDALSSVLVSGPANGSLNLNTDGSFTYIPGADFNGTDGFTYKVNDGFADSTVATVALTITPVNDAPAAVNDACTTAEDTVLVETVLNGVLGNDSDVDGDALTATLVSGPAHGTLTFNTDGSFTYTPSADFNGMDSFTYKANDGLADSAVATVALTITPVNDAPAAANDAYTTAEDTQLVINAAAGVLANDTDVEGDALSAVLVSGPAHGNLNLSADGSFTYTPGANFSGADSFTYKTNDGTTDSTVATVALSIIPMNDAPVAGNDSYTTAQGAPLVVAAQAGVLANDSDVDGEALSSVLVSGPAHGSLSLNADGSFTYTPVASFNGTDSFTYQANDGLTGSNIATAILAVTPGISGADLLTTAVSGPASVNAGDSISVSATLRNQGALAAGASNVGIYLSTSGTANYANYYLGSIAAGSLAAGAEQSVSGTLAVAANVTPQTYYLWAIADRNGQVQENNESNNSAVGNQIAVSAAQPMLASVAPTPAIAGGVSILTAVALDPIVQEAIRRWDEALHLSETQIALLTEVTFQVTDLSGLTLGQAEGATITLDIDAAGYGWFIDTTPGTNNEFTRHHGKTDMSATPSSAAFGDIDLLTVVMHEFGHVLGYSDVSIDGQGTGIMDATLDAGERLLPGPVKKAKRSAKPAKTHEALVFDEMSGEFVNANKTHRRAKQDPGSMRFEPLLTGAAKSAVEEKDGWIVEV